MSVVPFFKPTVHADWHARIGKVTLKRNHNVTRLGVLTSLDLDPAIVLAGALAANLSHVVIMGYDQEGEHYFASSMNDGGTVLWLAEQMKKDLLAVTVPDRTQGPTSA